MTERAPDAASNAATATILLVDDDVLGVSLRRRVLEAAGYTVLEAYTGQAGLQMVDRHSIDLVVLDFHLPDLNGNVVLAGMRSRKPGLLVIQLSGILGVDDASATPDVVLLKGGGPVALLRTIADLLAPPPSPPA